MINGLDFSLIPNPSQEAVDEWNFLYSCFLAAFFLDLSMRLFDHPSKFSNTSEVNKYE